MVIYDLKCNSEHCFEGWFSNRKEFEEQLASGMIECPICRSTSLTEKLSAPSVHVGRRTAQLDSDKRQASLSAQSDRMTEARSSTREQDTQQDLDDTSLKAPATLDAKHNTALRAATEVIQQVLDKHFENVGSQFYDQVLSIHLGESEPRNLKGTATDEEERDLEELGVPFQKFRLPRFDD